MKLLNRKWAIALITATMFGTAGATIAAADANAGVVSVRPGDRGPVTEAS